MKDESNFHEYFGHTLRCTTGGKVKGGDACILWIDVPHYFSNDGNSFNYVNYKNPKTGDFMCRVRNNYFDTPKYFIFT